MAPLKRRAVEQMFRSKLGMTERQGDHRFYEFLHQGELVAATKISVGSSHNDLSANLVAQIAKQMRVNSRQLAELVDCSISKADYEAHLQRNGLI